MFWYWSCVEFRCREWSDGGVEMDRVVLMRWMEFILKFIPDDDNIKQVHETKFLNALMRALFDHPKSFGRIAPVFGSCESFRGDSVEDMLAEAERSKKEEMLAEAERNERDVEEASEDEANESKEERNKFGTLDNIQRFHLLVLCLILGWNCYLCCNPPEMFDCTLKDILGMPMDKGIPRISRSVRCAFALGSLFVLAGFISALQLMHDIRVSPLVVGAAHGGPVAIMQLHVFAKFVSIVFPLLFWVMFAAGPIALLVQGHSMLIVAWYQLIIGIPFSALANTFFCVYGLVLVIWKASVVQTTNLIRKMHILQPHIDGLIAAENHHLVPTHNLSGVREVFLKNKKEKEKKKKLEAGTRVDQDAGLVLANWKVDGQLGESAGSTVAKAPSSWQLCWRRKLVRKTLNEGLLSTNPQDALEGITTVEGIEDRELKEKAKEVAEKIHWPYNKKEDYEARPADYWKELGVQFTQLNRQLITAWKITTYPLYSCVGLMALCAFLSFVVGTGTHNSKARFGLFVCVGVAGFLAIMLMLPLAMVNALFESKDKLSIKMIARLHLGDVPRNDKDVGDAAMVRYQAFCDNLQNSEGGVSVLFLGTVTFAKLSRMAAALATVLPAVARITQRQFDHSNSTALNQTNYTATCIDMDASWLNASWMYNR